MVSDEPVDGRCNARAGPDNDGYCEGWPMDNGRCYRHGGRREDDDRDPGGAPEGNQNAVGNSGGGAPEGNDNAEKYGLFSDRRKWYDRQDDETKEGVRKLHAHWLEHANNPEGASAELWNAAIDEFRMGQADLYIDDEGLIVENTVGYDEDGEPQVRREENPALLPKSRMRRDNLRVLKDTGVIGSADDRIAGAMEDALEVDVDEGTKEALRKALQERYQRGSEELRNERQADHNTPTK